MPYPRARINLPFRDVLLALLYSTGWGMTGAEERFRRELADFLSNQQVIPVGSGRDALRALLELQDWPSGAEVVFPAYTYHPMAVEVASYGYRPVFADVEPGTWNIDPVSVAARIGPKTKAVIPTHFLGLPAELMELRELCDTHGLMLIEDCAHAFGSTYRGKPVGTIGDAGIFTFAMSKNMPCFGGGALTVRDSALFQQVSQNLQNRHFASSSAIWRRQFGNVAALVAGNRLFFPLVLYPLIRSADILGSNCFDRKFIEMVISPGGSPSTSRPMAPLQAAIGCRQLARFPAYFSEHLYAVGLLRDMLKTSGDLILQEIPQDRVSASLSVRVRVDNPAGFRRLLLRAGIDTRPDEMRNCAELDIFDDHPACPVAARLAGHCIEVPCSQVYTPSSIERIAGIVQKAAAAAGS